jgi:hypothetical protein
MKFLVTEVRTVKVEAPTRRAALEKGRLVLEHYAPDTIDLSVEPVEGKDERN